MILLECNGLPGSGKTTTIKQLQRELELQGIKADTLASALMNLGKPKRVLYKAIYGRNGFTGLPGIVDANQLDYMQCKRSIDAIGRMYREYMAIVHGCKELEVCLIDQGLLQGVLSVFYDKNIIAADELSIFFKDVHSKFPHLIEINGHIPVGVAVDRILTRHQQGENAGRLDRLSGKRLVSCMNVQISNLYTLREKARTEVECFDIDLTKSPSENSGILINEFRKRGMI